LLLLIQQLCISSIQCERTVKHDAGGTRSDPELSCVVSNSPECKDILFYWNVKHKKLQISTFAQLDWDVVVFAILPLREDSSKEATVKIAAAQFSVFTTNQLIDKPFKLICY